MDAAGALDDNEAVVNDSDEQQEDSVELDIDGWVMMDSDLEDEDFDEADQTTGLQQKTRVQAAYMRPEFVDLQKAGLTDRPAGCTVGVHEGSRVWRTSCPGSKHFGRVWGEGSGRSPKQALIRVLILMFQHYCETNNADRLAKKQLKRLEDLWSSDPGKP